MTRIEMSCGNCGREWHLFGMICWPGVVCLAIIFATMVYVIAVAA